MKLSQVSFKIIKIPQNIFIVKYLTNYSIRFCYKKKLIFIFLKPCIKLKIKL